MAKILTLRLVTMQEYQNIFQIPNWYEKVFMIKNLNILYTVPWTYAVGDLNGEEIVGTFYEKELQKTN